MLAGFDPKKFEERYVRYFEELETAYSNAYQQPHGQADSDVLRVIDRQVLNESETAYEGDGRFRITLPDDIEERRQALPGDEEAFDVVLTEFVARIKDELQRIFGFEA